MIAGMFQALDGAAEAISTAGSSSSKVRAALETVNSILDQLSKLSSTLNLTKKKNSFVIILKLEIDVHGTVLMKSSVQ